MATRPVFEVIDEAPFYRTVNVDFVWNRGLNINQKRKNVAAIHEAYNSIFPDKRVLEISSKSLQAEGLPLSAFALEKFVPSLNKRLTVEKLYQGGKVFENGGPYLDMYEGTSRQAKRDERLHNSGRVKSFYYDGHTYSVEHCDAFYNWLYINALLENEELSKPLLEYDAFTDVAFTPTKGTSCQAKSAAIFVALSRNNMLSEVGEFDKFVRAVYK